MLLLFSVSVGLKPNLQAYINLKEKIKKGYRLNIAQRNYIRKFEESNRKNGERIEFENNPENKKIINFYKKSINGLKQKEISKFIKSLPKESSAIINQYRKNRKEYENDWRELKAFEDGANEAKKFKNEIDERVLRRFRGIGRIQQGTFERNVGTETQSKTRPIGEYYTRRSKGLANELQEVISHISDDIDEILPKVKKPSDKVFQRIITPISTRLESISPRIKHSVRKFELDSSLTENKYAETVKPFIENLSKIFCKRNKTKV